MSGAQSRHPGGVETTARLISMAELAPCRILDMGAGDGAAVRWLTALGFEAEGIDLAPGEGVRRGNFLSSPWPDGAFDAVISECAFYISGDAEGAAREAARLLRPGGRLLLSDISFDGAESHRAILAGAGLRVLRCEDISGEWKRYYIECIWRGTADALPDGQSRGSPKYYLTVCERT